MFKEDLIERVWLEHVREQCRLACQPFPKRSLRRLLELQALMAEEITDGEPGALWEWPEDD